MIKIIVTTDSREIVKTFPNINGRNIIDYQVASRAYVCEEDEQVSDTGESVILYNRVGIENPLHYKTAAIVECDDLRHFPNTYCEFYTADESGLSDAIDDNPDLHWESFGNFSGHNL